MSKLDTYISKLLSDDEALQAFLVDPVKAAEDENDLSKAQRSVLRRVVANLSTNSTNGYGVVRHLNSYRRSIRLLQNVLHVERGTAVGNHLQAHAKGATTFIPVYIYYSGNPDQPGNNPGDSQPTVNPYQYYMLFHGSGDTIDAVMNSARDVYNNKLQELITVSDNNPSHPSDDYGAGALTSVKVPDNYPAPGVYEAAPQDLGSRAPFWFWSLGGTALDPKRYYDYINPNAYYGSIGETFIGQPVGSGQAIFWQVIAPDVVYGFDSCEPSTVQNVFGA
ncbi:MAG: hypothetical protein AAGA66_03015 [Bacteroidota bacterium]